VKASLIFLQTTLCEIGQFLGLYFLGRTFDPIDIAVHALGVLLTAFVDCIILSNLNFGKIVQK
jgi:hypothetical protein